MSHAVLILSSTTVGTGAPALDPCAVTPISVSTERSSLSSPVLIYSAYALTYCSELLTSVIVGMCFSSILSISFPAPLATFACACLISSTSAALRSSRAVTSAPSVSRSAPSAFISSLISTERASMPSMSRLMISSIFMALILH